MASLRGLRGTAKRKAMQQAVVRCQLADVLRTRVHALSKGFRQRLGLACVILHEPDVLILDEPINGLDPQQIQSFMALLPVLAEGRTLIFSSHILVHLDQVCDHVLMLNRGRLCFSGSPMKWFEQDPQRGIQLTLDGDPHEVLPVLRRFSESEVAVIEQESGPAQFNLPGDWSDSQCAELLAQLQSEKYSVIGLERVKPDSNRIFQHLLQQPEVH
jgi:ABC-2 type transport system ATP-binding protein